jgi:hypothetical protein
MGDLWWSSPAQAHARHLKSKNPGGDSDYHNPPDDRLRKGRTALEQHLYCSSLSTFKISSSE